MSKKQQQQQQQQQQQKTRKKNTNEEVAYHNGIGIATSSEMVWLIMTIRYPVIFLLVQHLTFHNVRHTSRVDYGMHFMR
jgi:hypothetical protein